ncbi:MAG: hypothetical protein ACJA0G_000200 [Kangiellaceae bacterium]|jgi:hypothetical protein
MNDEDEDFERGGDCFDIKTLMFTKNMAKPYLNQSGLIANSNKRGTKP